MFYINCKLIENQLIIICSISVAQANSKSENAVDDSDSDEDDDEYDDENEIEINSGNELRDKDKMIAEEIDGLNNHVIDRKFDFIQ